MGCLATVWERAACRHVVWFDGLLWPLELWDCSCDSPGSDGALGGATLLVSPPSAPRYSLFGSRI